MHGLKEKKIVTYEIKIFFNYPNFNPHKHALHW